MRSALPLTLAALLAVSPALAQEVEGVAPTAPGLQDADLPPLLDREVFFGNPALAGAQISPDGRFITFLKPYNDVMNVWVKGADEPFDAARPLTADDRPVPGYFWSRDSRYVLYVQDREGDENYHVYAVDPTAAAMDAGVPPARDLTPVDGVRAFIYDVPKDDPAHLLVGLNDRDAAWHDVYRVAVATGERELLLENTRQLTGFVTDAAGAIHLATRTADDGSTEVLGVEEGRLGEVVYTCTVMETCSPFRLHADDRRVYMETNRGERDLSELVLFDPATREETLVERDPDGEVDFGGAEFSDVTGELLLTTYTGDRQRHYPKTDEARAMLETLREALPEGDLNLGSATADERKIIVSVSSDVDPGSVYLFDRDAGTATLLYRSRPELPSAYLAAVQPVRYRARDGREIPAYLVLPKGSEARGLPTLLFPHGGPWARDYWGYDAIAQFLANRGYAVLMPNFRGSTGYGKDFLNAGNLGWGTGPMQHDLSDAVQYLVGEGIADPERVGIIGGSYGGYAVLAGLAYTPELYAVGVDLFGPSNLITLLNTIPPYWAQIRQMFYERMGNPEAEEGRAQLEAQSPLHAAGRIEDPLLIFQGANDPRVKQAESDQIVVALRDRGYPVSYLVAPDEGHGIADETNRLAVMAAIERFLAEHLGGRYQPDVRPELQERLEALTVDPASVTLAAPAEAGPLFSSDVFDAAAFQPMTLRYTAQLKVQGTELPLEVTRTVEADGDAWRILDAASGIPGMGTITDTLWVDHATLAPRRRGVSQGPVQIALAYAPDAVTGTMQAQGQATPVDVALDAPLAVEGALLDLALGTLPLEEGYRAAFQGFDLQSQQPTTFTVEVTGTEAVAVPAGTFEAHVVSLTKGDGTSGGNGTLYVDTATGTLVKSEMDLGPQMGGATMTMELTGM